MSYIDLATLAIHRRNEMEARINSFVAKCDQATEDIVKLKLQAQSFVNYLNCEPMELKERFLSCMKTLDEYIYLITDFNLAVEQHLPKDATGSIEYTPVHDTSGRPLLIPQQTFNILDILSEPTPSTSRACPNQCPVVHKPKKNKIPKDEQTLIVFSSASCSCESVPMTKEAVVKKEMTKEAVVKTEMTKKTVVKKEKKGQCGLEEGINEIRIKEVSPPPLMNLPAQTILQTEQQYPATIMNIDGASLWLITDDIEDATQLMNDMTVYYKQNRVELSLEDITALTYCAFYDEDCYYRGLFIRLTQEDVNVAEVFLVDTGEMRCADARAAVQPLAARFFAQPPYARCCHLAGVDLLVFEDKETMDQQEEFLRKFIGTQCTIEVDDNSSESLGVYVKLPNSKTLNELIVEEGLAMSTDKSASLSSTAKHRSSTPTTHTAASVHTASKYPATTSPHLTSKHPNPSHRATSVHSATASVHSATSGSVLTHGPPDLNISDSDLDMADCHEYEDPVEAVTGYSCRDEADICKHYKGGPEKTCFKGTRCKKRHVLKHPDGWTLDRVEVLSKLTPAALPAPGTWQRAHVTYVCHFDRLYVQFVREKVEELLPDFGVVLPPMTLESLIRDMNSPAARIAYKPLKIMPALGELVAALYPLDDQWYRARVQSIARVDQTVEVMYVDYGNVVWVKENAIRALEPRWTHLPIQAVRVALAGVTANSHDSRHWAAAKQQLQLMTQDRTLDTHIIARDYDEVTVEMFDEHGYSIAEQLAAHNMVALKEYSVLEDSATQKVVVP